MVLVDVPRVAEDRGQDLKEGVPGLRYLVLIGGLAGSGKTEFAKILARRTRWSLLDKDTLTRPLVERLASVLCGNPDDRHTPTYFNEVRPLEYKALLDTAGEILQFGASVIVTAPFIRELSDPDFIGTLEDLAYRNDANLQIVWLHADWASMFDRLMQRGASRDRWKLANWEDYIASTEPQVEPCIDHWAIDNSASGPRNLGEWARDLTTTWSLE